MSSWSSKRKFQYGFAVIIVLIIVIGIPLFLLFYKSPTCNDGIMNGDETGIDCGGSCVLLCQNSFLSPYIAWGGAKFEQVAPGLYNIASYIVNKNINGSAVNVPYKISLYDDKGILITERTGYVTLYAHRNSLAFEPAVQTGKRIPSKATFEFLKAPVWFKSHDTLEQLKIVDKKYLEDDKNSSLEVTLENTSLYPYKDVIVSAVLSDSNGNIIGFSRTNIDSIEANNGKEIAGFTWPVSRKGEVKTIEILPIITPVFDR